MNYRIASTPDGLVVRCISVDRECAYRRNNDGTYAYCAGHKGPWVTCEWSSIPVEVADFMMAGVIGNPLVRVSR